MSETPTPALAANTTPPLTEEQKRILKLERQLQDREKKNEKLMKGAKTGGIILLVIALLVVGAFCIRTASPGSATTNVKNAVSNDSVNTNNATAKVEADANKETYERQLEELRKQLAEAKPSTVGIEATVANAVAAAIAKAAPAPAPAPAPATATTISTEGDIVSQMNEGLRLQYGTARVHSETVPPPGLTWLDVGSIQIPIFRNPHQGNNWAFVTGDLLNGVKTPPRPHEVPVPSGRTWVPVTQANIPPSGAINPDGQDMQIHLALQDGALIYGTVPIR